MEAHLILFLKTNFTSQKLIPKIWVSHLQIPNYKMVHLIYMMKLGSNQLLHGHTKWVQTEVGLLFILFYNSMIG